MINHRQILKTITCLILLHSNLLLQAFCQKDQRPYGDIKYYIENFDYTKRVVPKMPTPGKQIRVIIDTDAKNEIDDQWAIALAILSQDRFKIEGFVAAPYLTGGPEGIKNSYDEIKTVLALANMTNKLPVYEGSHPMRYQYEGIRSEGVDLYPPGQIR